MRWYAAETAPFRVRIFFLNDFDSWKIKRGMCTIFFKHLKGVDVTWQGYDFIFPPPLFQQVQGYNWAASRHRLKIETLLHRTGRRLADTGGQVWERRSPKGGRSPSRLWWGVRSSNKRMAVKEVAAAWIKRADHRESKTETVPIWPKFLFGSAKKGILASTRPKTRSQSCFTFRVSSCHCLKESLTWTFFHRRRSFSTNLCNALRSDPANAEALELLWFLPREAVSENTWKYDMDQPPVSIWNTFLWTQPKKGTMKCV